MAPCERVAFICSFILSRRRIFENRVFSRPCALPTHYVPFNTRETVTPYPYIQTTICTTLREKIVNKI